MPGIGRDLLVGDPAAVEAERDSGGQVARAMGSAVKSWAARRTRSHGCPPAC